MKLIVQPDAGIAPVVSAIKQAKKSINILIFRLDRAEIAHALEAAVARGVRVRALTAHAKSLSKRSRSTCMRKTLSLATSKAMAPPAYGTSLK